MLSSLIPQNHGPFPPQRATVPHFCIQSQMTEQLCMQCVGLCSSSPKSFQPVCWRAAPTLSAFQQAFCQSGGDGTRIFSQVPCGSCHYKSYKLHPKALTYPRSLSSCSLTPSQVGCFDLKLLKMLNFYFLHSVFLWVLINVLFLTILGWQRDDD